MSSFGAQFNLRQGAKSSNFHESTVSTAEHDTQASGIFLLGRKLMREVVRDEPILGVEIPDFSS